MKLFVYKKETAHFYAQPLLLQFMERGYESPTVQWFRRRTKLRRFLLCSFLLYITLKDLLQVSVSWNPFTFGLAVILAYPWTVTTYMLHLKSFYDKVALIK